MAIASRAGALLASGHILALDGRDVQKVSCSFYADGAKARWTLRSSCSHGCSRRWTLAFPFALSDRASELEERTSSRVFVGNLPWLCDRDGLMKVLEQIGIVPEMVAEVEVVYDKDSGKSRGFGYVTLATAEMAQVAIEKLDGYVLEGRGLKSGYSHPYRKFTSPSNEETQFGHTKVFVGNLPWQVDDGTLEEIFSQYGRIVDTSVIYDRDTGRSRGFGFVTLSTPSEAKEAAAALDGAHCDGRTLRVTLVDRQRLKD